MTVVKLTPEQMKLVEAFHAAQKREGELASKFDEALAQGVYDEELAELVRNATIETLAAMQAVRNA